MCESRSRSSRSPPRTIGTLILALAAGALVYGSLLAFRSPDAEESLRTRPCAVGLIAIGSFSARTSATTARCCRWSRTVRIDGVVLIAGTIERRTTTINRAASAEMAKEGRRSRPVVNARRYLARRARLRLICRGIPDPRGAPSSVIGGGRDRVPARSCSRRCTCFGDLRRAAPGARIDRQRRALRLAPGRARAVVPLVGVLLALSAWRRESRITVRG